MSIINPFEQSELVRLALSGLDTQIAELQAKRAQLAAMATQPLAAPMKLEPVPPQKGGKMSEEAKAKISVAAKARWARVKKAKTEATKKSSAGKEVPTKAQKSSVKKATADSAAAKKKSAD